MLTDSAVAITSSTCLTLNSGSGAMSASVGDTFSLTAASTLALESSGGAINVGATNVAQAVNIASAGARAVTLGSAAYCHWRRPHAAGRDQRLEVGDQVVVVEVVGSGQRSILRCEAANTAAGTNTILAK